jgi:hypothetical protein
MPLVSVRLVDVTPEDTVMVVIAGVPMPVRRRVTASARRSWAARSGVGADPAA